MRKNGLLKVILIVLGVFLLISGVLGILGYFIPELEGLFNIVPVGNVFLNFVQSFYYFYDTVVYLLVLGAFYGVLNEVTAYKKLIEKIVTGLKSHGKVVLIVITILFSILTAVTGQLSVLLIFVPFVVMIILGLGYDKLVAVSSTIVSMLIGLMSGIYVTFRDPNNYYEYSSTTFEGVLGVDLYSNLWPKLILLVLGTALLIFFVLRHINNVQKKKVKYELNESNEVEVSEVTGDYKKIRTWPIIVVFALLFVILILGYMPWNTLFGIDCFDKFNEWLLGIKIGEFYIIPNLVSSNNYAFGNWASMGDYLSIILTLIIFTIIIKFIYNIKFSDVLNNFVNGAKKILPMVLIMILAYTVLVSTYNGAFVQSIITWLNEVLGINIGSSVLISALGTLYHSDLYYTVSGTLLPMMQNVSDKTLYPTYILTFQTIYGIVSMIAPTSLFVVFAVKYFDIPYTSFVKYIWRFILMLFLLVLLVLLVLALIL